MSTTLSDDLAYVRDLAEAGQTAPLLSGRFLIWWGALLSLAYTGHYLIAKATLAKTDPAFAWLWGVFFLVGIAGQAVLVRSIRLKPGTNSVGNRVETTVWCTAGFALFAFFAGLVAKSLLDGAPAPEFGSSFSLVFAIYSIGLLTSGVMGKTPILRHAGYTALGFVALLTIFSGTTLVWAVAALGAFLTVFLPGVVLIRQEPKSIV